MLSASLRSYNCDVSLCGVIQLEAGELSVTVSAAPAVVMDLLTWHGHGPADMAQGFPAAGQLVEGGWRQVLTQSAGGLAPIIPPPLLDDPGTPQKGFKIGLGSAFYSGERFLSIFFWSG